MPAIVSQIGCLMKEFLAKLAKGFLHIFNLIRLKNPKYIFLRSYFPYQDNVQAVLDEMIRQNINGDHIIFCAGNGFERYEGINNVILLHCSKFKEIMLYTKSKYVIWDSSIYFNTKSIKKQISFNLWHGVSFKNIGFLERKNEKPYRTSTHVVTYSPLFADKMAKAFGVPINDIVLAGEPRNDYFAKPLNNSELESFGIKLFNSETKLIMWMPTFRQSKNHNVNNGKLYPFGFPFLDIQTICELHEFCAENNIFLILKWHGSQVLPNIDNLDGFSHFCFLTTDDLTKTQTPLYSIVSRCHALITDYSSIFVNYLVLNRPICFAYDDLEDYISDRGFMFDDIEALMPGHKAKDFQSLKLFLKSIADSKDLYSDERQKSIPLFNTNNDYFNSKRLVDFMNQSYFKNEKQ